MEQIIIGDYYFGFDSIKLIMFKGNGGSFYSANGKGKTGVIKIGGDEKQWRHIIDLALHEFYEYAFMRLGCRYDSDFNFGNTHETYLFVANHKDFGEACAMVGDLLSDCYDDLKKAWKKMNKKGDKKNEKK